MRRHQVRQSFPFFPFLPWPATNPEWAPSGESGAGKTESAKYMIRHIIKLCHSAGSEGTQLERKILQVNPFFLKTDQVFLMN